MLITQFGGSDKATLQVVISRHLSLSAWLIFVEKET